MNDPYSRQLRALFRDPAHAGRIDDGIAAQVDDQGVRIHLTLSVSGGRIGSARFQAWGCPHVLAACEAFCASVEGRELADLCDYSAAPLMQSLAIPAEKTGRILVLEDAVRSLGAAACAPNDSQS